MKNKIAIVHDFLLYYGGAEKVLEEISSLFPKAPIFVLLENNKMAEKYFPQKEIIGSFLQKAPKFLRRRHKYLLPLMPTAAETFDLRDYDVVVSSSSAFAKGVVVKPKTKHICYMHCPMRYVWDWSYEYVQEQRLKGKAKLFTRFFLNYLRMWDRASADRVDHFVANSQFTAERIKKYYRRDSDVIYPPVSVEKFSPIKENDGFFLSVCRLSGYKRVKLIVDVFQKLKLPLVVVGEGNQRCELEKMTQGDPMIKIIGWVDEAKLIKLYERSRAFVCASEDDFNITAVEAMAAGKPVIALRKGGVVETVQEGVTGEFFDAPQMEIMADGVRRFIENEGNYDCLKIRLRAEEYSQKRFKSQFKDYVEKAAGGL